MDLAKVQKIVKKVQASLFRHSNSYFQGVFQTSFKGSGVQFKEHQVYQYGDDVRFIDWGLLARKDMTYVKTFEEERNVHILCVLPIRSSMMFKDAHETKIEAALETICFFILMAGKTKDYVDLLIDTEKVSVVRNLQGELGIIKLFKMLEKLGVLTNSGRVNYEKILDLDSPIRFSEYQKYFERNKQIVFLGDSNSVSLIKNEKIFKLLKAKIFRFYLKWEKNKQKNLIVFNRWFKGNEVSGENDELMTFRDKRIFSIDVNGQHLEEVAQVLMKGI